METRENPNKLHACVDCKHFKLKKRESDNIAEHEPAEKVPQKRGEEGEKKSEIWYN